MRTTRWLASGLLCLMLALAGSPVRAQDGDLKPAQKVKRDRYVLSAEELAEHPDLTNAYDAVRALRPGFLKGSRPAPTGSVLGPDGTTKVTDYGARPTSAGTLVFPVVYFDEKTYMTLEDLKTIRVADVLEIRYFMAADFQRRYGYTVEAGALVVKQQPRRPE